MHKLIDVCRWVVEGEFDFKDDQIESIFNRITNENEQELVWNNLHDIDINRYLDEFFAGVSKLMKETQKEKTNIKSHL